MLVMAQEDGSYSSFGFEDAKRMTTGMSDFSTKPSGVCRGCALGKYTKTAFPSIDNRSEGVLDLIHSDLCGPPCLLPH